MKRYIEILNNVFEADGIENNKKLLNDAFDSDYRDVIEINDRIVGFLFANINKKNSDKISDYLSYNYNFVKKYLNDDDAYINLLVVDTSHQSKGYGSYLIKRFIEYCEKEKIKNIYLWCDLSCNTVFYEKLHFELIECYNNPFFNEYCNVKCDKKENSYIYKLTIS